MQPMLSDYFYTDTTVIINNFRIFSYGFLDK